MMSQNTACGSLPLFRKRWSSSPSDARSCMACLGTANKWGFSSGYLILPDPLTMIVTITPALKAPAQVRFRVHQRPHSLRGPDHVHISQKHLFAHHDVDSCNGAGTARHGPTKKKVRRAIRLGPKH